MLGERRSHALGAPCSTLLTCGPFAIIARAMRLRSDQQLKLPPSCALRLLHFMQDVKALLVLATLHIDGVVDFAGCIANGGGAPEMRARLARCLLDRLGATDVPVAVGSAGQLVTPQPHEYALPGYDEVDPARLGAGPLLMLSVLATSPPGSLTVVLISSLRDFADAINEHGELVSRAVKSVSVMGGLERSETAQFGWVADSSVNNGFDPEGAQRVYDWCFAEGVPLSVVSRFAVPLLPMQLARSVRAGMRACLPCGRAFSLFSLRVCWRALPCSRLAIAIELALAHTRICSMPHPKSFLSFLSCSSQFAERTNSDVLKYLADAQFLGLEGLWSRLCDGKLPPRCSKQVRRHSCRTFPGPACAPRSALRLDACDGGLGS